MKILESASETLLRLEKRWGIPLTGLAIGVVLFLAATVLVAPRLTTVGGAGLSPEFQNLSEEPFNFSRNSPLQYRILTPLLAHVLMLRGRLYPVFPLLIGVALLATVYVHFRKSSSPMTSAAAAAMMAFSMPLLSSFFCAGYPDAVSYLLIWICLTATSLPLQCTAFALMLLNHESTAFAFPFLAYRPWNQEPIRKTVLRAVLLLAMFIPLVAYRKYVDLHSAPLLGAGYYLNVAAIADNVKKVAHFAALGLFEAFRLFWYVVLFALLVLVRSRKIGEAAWLILVVGCACLPLVLACDTGRFTALAFPAVLLSIKVLGSHFDKATLEKSLWLLFAANFFVPVYFTWERQSAFLLPWPILFLLKLVGMDGWKI